VDLYEIAGVLQSLAEFSLRVANHIDTVTLLATQTQSAAIEAVTNKRASTRRPPRYIQSCPVQVTQLSDHVHRAVEEERAIVTARLAALRAQSERLHRVVEQVDADVEKTAHLLRRIEEVLGIAPQLSLEAQGELRGQKLREIAVEFLRDSKGVGAEVHYKEWYALLLDAGLRVGGRDPLATFLTQIARAPGVESVRPRSGLYRLQAA
jgi:hypothetical protein